MFKYVFDHLVFSLI